MAENKKVMHYMNIVEEYFVIVIMLPIPFYGNCIYQKINKNYFIFSAKI